jgi:hypothetical protein
MPPRLICRDCGVQVMAVRDLSRGCIYVSDHECAPLPPRARPWDELHPRLAALLVVVLPAVLFVALWLLERLDR